jgi:hypothetical protein
LVLIVKTPAGPDDQVVDVCTIVPDRDCMQNPPTQVRGGQLRQLDADELFPSAPRRHARSLVCTPINRARSDRTGDSSAARRA